MMRKRYRFAIILAVLAVCFVFLWPSLRWHFFTPMEQQARAMQSREQLRNSAMLRAESDFQRLLELGRAEEALARLLELSAAHAAGAGPAPTEAFLEEALAQAREEAVGLQGLADLARMDGWGLLAGPLAAALPRLEELAGEEPGASAEAALSRLGELAGAEPGMSAEAAFQRLLPPARAEASNLQRILEMAREGGAAADGAAFAAGAVSADEALQGRLLAQAREGGSLPPDLAFLIGQARRLNRDNRRPNPARWDARAALAAFPTPLAVRDAIENRYRDDVFSLRSMQRRAVQLGLDLSGGLSIVLQADMDALQERLDRPLTDADRDDAMERALIDLNSRIDQFGLTEPVIRRQGPDQIYVEIPGSADPERINDIIMGRGSLTFHIVDEDATAAFNAFYGAHGHFATFDGLGNLRDPMLVPPDVVIRGVYEQDRFGLNVPVYWDRDRGLRRYVAVRREVGLDGYHIRSALVERDQFGRPEVIFNMTGEGGELFWNLTSANVQRPMAIVLDDRVRSYPTIQTAIRDRVRLTGFGMDEANGIAMMLRTAGLPVTLEVASQQSIGASMGEDTIRQGLFALLGGVAMVLVFMLLFYKSAGINAVVAQLLNFYIMFSVLSAFSFTLTLPSIAGFILTIGMATDANVIVFERIKEELRLGKSRKAAIEIGFDKAFWAVMDSNVTTFIAALFLAQLGSGPIQGFAVALSVGVFSSVFTALFVSRLIFDFGTEVLRSRTIPITWAKQRVAGAAVGGTR